MKEMEITWYEFDTNTNDEIEKTETVKLKRISAREETEIMKSLKDSGGNLDKIDSDPYMLSLFKQKLLSKTIVGWDAAKIGNLEAKVSEDLFREALLLWKPSIAKNMKSPEASEKSATE